MAARQSTIMAGSDMVYDYTCNPCEESDKNTEATHYCINCARQFCDECLKMHDHIFKKHNVQGREKVSMWSMTSDNVSVGNLSLNSTISESHERRQMCALHTAEIQTYCRDHDVVCCTVCVATKHRFCMAVDHIPDVAKGFRRDKTFQTMLARVEKLQKRLKQLQTNRQKNKEALMESCSDIIASIKELRQKLNNILNQLEMKTIEEMDRVLLGLNDTLQTQINSCNSLQDEMASILETMEDKGKESDISAFISHKRCKEKIHEAENLMNSLIEQDYEVKFNPVEEIEQTLSELRVLGELTIIPDLSSGPLTTVKPGSALSIEEIGRYNVKTQMENQGEISTNGMVVLKNGNTVIIDNINNNMKLLNENRVLIAQRRLLSSPHDICAVSDTRVAITFSDWTKKEIQFFDTSTGKIEPQDKLKMKHSCYGIHHHDGKLYVSSHSAIYLHAMDGRQEKVLYENKSSRYAIFRFTVSDNGKRIYITNKTSNLLMTVDEEGKIVATMSDADLKFPSGVCAVGDGSVLVCGYESQTVLHLDPDARKKLATVARNCEGVNNPWCMCYNKITSQLLIGGHDDVLLGLTLK